MEVGDRVRFIERYGTGILPDGGPRADEGYETTVEEVVEETDKRRAAALVRIPYGGGTVPQYVPQEVLEVIENE